MHIKKVRPLNIWQINGPVVSVPAGGKVLYNANTPSIPIPTGEHQTLHFWNVNCSLGQDGAAFELSSGVYMGINLWADEAQTLWLVSLFLAAYGPPSKYAAALASGGMECDPSGSVSLGATSAGDVPLIELPDMINLSGDGVGSPGYARFASVYATMGVHNQAAGPKNFAVTLATAWSLES